MTKETGCVRNTATRLNWMQVGGALAQCRSARAGHGAGCGAGKLVLRKYSAAVPGSSAGYRGRGLHSTKYSACAGQGVVRGAMGGRGTKAYTVCMHKYRAAVPGSSTGQRGGCLHGNK